MSAVGDARKRHRTENRVLTSADQLPADLFTDHERRRIQDWLTHGHSDPAGSDGYVPGEWDEVRDAFLEGLLSAEVYTKLQAYDEILRAARAFHDAWGDTKEDEIHPTALWESLRRILNPELP